MQIKLTEKQLSYKSKVQNTENKIKENDDSFTIKSKKVKKNSQLKRNTSKNLKSEIENEDENDDFKIKKKDVLLKANVSKINFENTKTSNNDNNNTYTNPYIFKQTIDNKE